MIEVSNLEERLDSRSFLDLLLGHALCNLQRFPGNTSYYAMAVLANINTVIEGLNDNSLLSGIAAIEHNHNFAGLQAGERQSTISGDITGVIQATGRFESTEPFESTKVSFYA